MTITTAGSAAGVTIDLAAVRRWLGILHGDSPGHVHVCSTGDWTGRIFGDLDAATTYASYLDQQGREGIYLRITTLRTDRTIGGRGGATDSAALPALWADLDLAGPGHAEQDLPPDETAGRAVIAATGLPEPTIWVHSGGGLYPIWLLTEPHTITPDNLDQAKALARDWQRIIEHAAASMGWRYGRGVGDLARVLRIPGTVNRKEGLARPCRIVGAIPHRYTVAQLQVALDAAMQRIAPAPATPPTAASPIISGPTNGTRAPGQVHPGEDFNARTEWSQVLGVAGWREHYRSDDDVTYWTRPGKPTGISASTNALGTDRLHVFTTSAAPLDGGESYSKFGAYAALHFGGDHKAAARALGQQGFGSGLPDPATEQATMIRDLVGHLHQPGPATATPTAAGSPATEPTPADPARTPPRIWTPEIDVTNPAVAADWLREEAGRGKLAGLFRRLDAIVHTPREGEDGYVPLTDVETNNDGPAQVRPVNDSTLASRITYTYGCFRWTKKGEEDVPVQALFPRPAARTAIDVPDMLPNLRVLRGVIHTPVVRPDGSLIEAPGYDPATGLLHLPEPGLVVPRVPEQPTDSDVRDAVKLLLEMIDGFPFISEHYRANYLGALLTPLLRSLTPPPYKLHAIEAHQPGSGKTLLANLARHIHGGVFRAELPEDDAELRKQITAILSITTGPVVVLDNVSGALKSSTLAGLLTTDLWDDRPLGSTSWTRSTNDRIWTVTGNNISIGGDLPRRTIRTVIDPGQPNPELRTGFAIDNLEGWVKERRGELLHALLTLVRAWVAAGKPLPVERASDSYARWVRTVEGIITTAGIAGQFDHVSTQVEVGTDDDEWSVFLAAVFKAYKDRAWTAKELLSDVDTGNLIAPGLIPAEALPDELAAKAAKAPKGPVGIAKSLGRWLANREGRWAGGLAVRCIGKDRDGIKEWQIRANSDRGES
ncbi:hypothetical protein OOK41_31750 [Micromonospora sp. NBC_01655]|uniref:hypothetical protein n=1 Tax=Micromonospora sp. NBC_01655 TaxID=2975983 RepID=UPI0022502493|nr:hypothetical protein [Micromonospora sp. NBC_01655]MCX4474836.1 hypothetical protein [Micromonospora sp. NBC_01655]